LCYLAIYHRDKIPEKIALKKGKVAGSSWLTPVILATQKAELRRIMVQSQPGHIVHKTLSQKTH
jgi:hypothetical protein